MLCHAGSSLYVPLLLRKMCANVWSRVRPRHVIFFSVLRNVNSMLTSLTFDLCYSLFWGVGGAGQSTEVPSVLTNQGAPNWGPTQADKGGPRGKNRSFGFACPTCSRGPACFHLLKELNPKTPPGWSHSARPNPLPPRYTLTGWPGLGGLEWVGGEEAHANPFLKKAPECSSARAVQ